MLLFLRRELAARDDRRSGGFRARHAGQHLRRDVPDGRRGDGHNCEEPHQASSRGHHARDAHWKLGQSVFIAQWTPDTQPKFECPLFLFWEHPEVRFRLFQHTRERGVSHQTFKIRRDVREFRTEGLNPVCVVEARQTPRSPRG